jgi:hypothetical protein
MGWAAALVLSALAQVIASPPPISDRAARANWRARMWREGQRTKRAQRRLEEALARVFVATEVEA